MAKSKTKNTSRVSSPAVHPRHGLPGFFITLEGGEGAGKSSQMTLLKTRLEEAGKTVLTSREPGGSCGAEAVRHVLLSGAAEPFGAEMEAILFSAARSDHVETVIKPALKNGSVVISDRFFDSTRVYQGVSGKVDDAFVRRLEHIACDNVWPDLTVIIDLDPEEGLKRANSRRNLDEVPDRFEKESLKLQKMRQKAYLKIAEEEPERCVVIDGNGAREEVFERLWRVVNQRMESASFTKTVGKKTNGGGPAKMVAKTKSKKLKMLSHKDLTTKKVSAQLEQD